MSVSCILNLRVGEDIKQVHIFGKKFDGWEDVNKVSSERYCSIIKCSY